MMQINRFTPTQRSQISSMQAASRPRSALRILMVSARYFPQMGGIETHIHETAKRIAARGHDVTVLTTDVSGTLPADEWISGVHVIRTRAWPRNRDYYIAPRIWTEVMKGNWDVVHVQGYHTGVPPLAMLAALHRRIPFVITFHSGGHSSRVRSAFRSLQWACLAPIVRRAASHVGVSEFEANFFSDTMGISRSRFVVVPNGAELPAARIASHESGDPLIVSIGRLERYKGHHRAIEAMPELLKQMPAARLRVLGEGPYKDSLIRLAHALGLDDVVTVRGIPTSERSAMAALLARADVVVLLSDYEAHPVAVLEALSLKKPVVVTDCSGFMEIAARGLVTAIPLNSDAADTAQAIANEILKPRSIADVDLPNWDDCADRLQAIYSSVVKVENESENGVIEPNIGFA